MAIRTKHWESVKIGPVPSDRDLCSVQSDDPFVPPGGSFNPTKERGPLPGPHIFRPAPKTTEKVSDATRPPSLRIGVPAKTGS